MGHYNGATYIAGEDELPALTPTDISKAKDKARLRAKGGELLDTAYTRESLGMLHFTEAEVDELLAESRAVSERKRAAESARIRNRQLTDETDRVVRELEREEQRKLRAKAAKVARERLGFEVDEGSDLKASK